MELNPTDSASASPVDTGTVMTTSSTVFFTACKK